MPSLLYPPGLAQYDREVVRILIVDVRIRMRNRPDDREETLEFLEGAQVVAIVATEKRHARCRLHSGKTVRASRGLRRLHVVPKRFRNVALIVVCASKFQDYSRKVRRICAIGSARKCMSKFVVVGSLRQTCIKLCYTSQAVGHRQVKHRGACLAAQFTLS